MAGRGGGQPWRRQAVGIIGTGHCGSAPPPHQPAGPAPTVRLCSPAVLLPTRPAAGALGRLNINPLRSGGAPDLLSGLLAPLRSALQLVNELTLGADDGVAEPLAVETICPIHGPTVRASLPQLLRQYGAWTRDALEATTACSVAVLYARWARGRLVGSCLCNMHACACRVQCARVWWAWPTRSQWVFPAFVAACLSP